jgi:hypothetical protein
MHITTRNVNTAFHTLVSIFHEGTANIIKKDSRNGPVIMIDEPVIVTYTHPRERVLFNSARDANPFFHLYEALWMLAGRFDVKSVAYYASNMKNYSDDGITLNGAYGHRWRCGIRSDEEGNFRHDVDQIQIIINHLRADPNSRRAVLQMWNVEDDLLKIGQQCSMCYGEGEIHSHNPTCPRCKGRKMEGVSKDVCCNLSVMFSLRPCKECEGGTGHFWNSIWPEPTHCLRCKQPTAYLDMTVTNRSNDMVWGMLGANYVHFTFLQEYIAGCLGVEVGKYHHFTNNLHVYDWNWKPEEWLKSDQEVNDRDSGIPARSDLYQWREGPKSLTTVPLVKNQTTFDRELPLFVSAFNGEKEPLDCVPYWKEPFFETVAKPALMAYRRYKQKLGSVGWCKEIKADDWRIACTNWIKRRIDHDDPSTACVGTTTDQLLNKGKQK